MLITIIVIMKLQLIALSKITIIRLTINFSGLIPSATRTHKEDQ